MVFEKIIFEKYIFFNNSREIFEFHLQNSELVGVPLPLNSFASVVVSTLDSWSEFPGSNPVSAKLCSLFNFLSISYKWSLKSEQSGRGMSSSLTAAKWCANAQIGPLCVGGTLLKCSMKKYLYYKWSCFKILCKIFLV